METNEQSNLNIKTILKYSTVEFVDTNESYIQKGVVGDFIEYPQVERVVESENSYYYTISVFYEFDKNNQYFDNDDLSIEIIRNEITVDKKIDWIPNGNHLFIDSLTKLYFRMTDVTYSASKNIYLESNITYGQDKYIYELTLFLTEEQALEEIIFAQLEIFYDNKLTDKICELEIEINPISSENPEGD